MEDFSFIQITDHHLGDSPGFLRFGYATNFAFEVLLRHIARNGAEEADFLLSTGDLVDPPTEAGYTFLRGRLGIQSSTPIPGPLLISYAGLARFPFYAIPGNHDDRAVMSRSLFASQSAVELVNAAFVHKGVQFVCIDWGPQAKAMAYPETLDFLRQKLDIGLPSVIVSHHAVTPVGSLWIDDFIADDVESFWQIITHPNWRASVLAVLCGHTHLTYDTQVQGIPVLGLRSSSYTFVRSDTFQMAIESPQYRLVSIRGGTLTSCVYDVDLPLAGRVELE